MKIKNSSSSSKILNMLIKTILLKSIFMKKYALVKNIQGYYQPTVSQTAKATKILFKTSIPKILFKQI